MIKKKQFQGLYGEKTGYAIWHINDLIQDYERTSSGHYFSPDTMRFFNSKVLEYFRGDGNNIGYFITSERYDSNQKRLYTIRKVQRVAAPDTFSGYKYEIETHGEFQGYKSSSMAKKAIQTILGVK